MHLKRFGGKRIVLLNSYGVDPEVGALETPDGGKT